MVVLVTADVETLAALNSAFDATYRLAQITSAIMKRAIAGGHHGRFGENEIGDQETLLSLYGEAFPDGEDAEFRIALEMFSSWAIDLATLRTEGSRLSVGVFI